jgi:sigma-B regulation protein RsbU (phosphoserine phosphatase)
LIDTVSRRISEVLHIRQIAVLLRSGGIFRLQHALGLSLDGQVLLPEDSSAVRQLKQTNAPAVLYRASGEEQAQLSSPDGRRLLGEMSTDVLLPLPGRNRLMGVIALGAKQSEEPYTPSDLRLLHSVGLQTGLALEVSELAQSLANETAQRARSDRELEIAHEVQQRLFPQRYPAIDGLTLAGHCRPAQGVGGDYYDVIELEDGRLGFAIGDVSGKGVSAALIMAGIRSCLRTMTLDGSMDLAMLMRKMNRLVYEASAVNRYATFFFAVYDPEARKLNYVNAGHNPPVLLRTPAGNRVEQKLLDVGGTVVGLLPDVTYEEQFVALAPGDLLLAYTDGISEAMTEEDEEWGEERMTQAAKAVCNETAERILQAIFEAADRFTGSAPQHDDMTLLVAKFD